MVVVPGGMDASKFFSTAELLKHTLTRVLRLTGLEATRRKSEIKSHC